LESIRLFSISLCFTHSLLHIRSDDNEEKAANRLAVHHKNVDAVVGKYERRMKNVDGNRVL